MTEAKMLPCPIGDQNCDQDRESKMVVIRTDDAGKALVWCDPCITQIVSALNAGGVNTVASCCGHGRRPASIVLADGREILIMPFEEARKLDGMWPDINGEITRPAASAAPSGEVFGDDIPDDASPAVLRAMIVFWRSLAGRRYKELQAALTKADTASAVPIGRGPNIGNAVSEAVADTALSAPAPGAEQRRVVYLIERNDLGPRTKYFKARPGDACFWLEDVHEATKFATREEAIATGWANADGIKVCEHIFGLDLPATSSSEKFLMDEVRKIVYRADQLDKEKPDANPPLGLHVEDVRWLCVAFHRHEAMKEIGP